MVACEEVGVSGGEGGGVAEGVEAAVGSGESEGEFSTVGGGKDLGLLKADWERALGQLAKQRLRQKHALEC